MLQLIRFTLSILKYHKPVWTERVCQTNAGRIKWMFYSRRGMGAACFQKASFLWEWIPESRERGSGPKITVACSRDHSKKGLSHISSSCPSCGRTVSESSLQSIAQWTTEKFGETRHFELRWKLSHLCERLTTTWPTVQNHGCWRMDCSRACLWNTLGEGLSMARYQCTLTWTHL